jgi:hypothetical protein
MCEHGQRAWLPAESFGQRAWLPAESFGQRAWLPAESFGQRTWLPAESFGQRAWLPAESFGQRTWLPAESFGHCTWLPAESYPQEALLEGGLHVDVHDGVVHGVVGHVLEIAEGRSDVVKQAAGAVDHVVLFAHQPDVGNYVRRLVLDVLRKTACKTLFNNTTPVHA